MGPQGIEGNMRGGECYETKLSALERNKTTRQDERQ